MPESKVVFTVLRALGILLDITLLAISRSTDARFKRERRPIRSEDLLSDRAQSRRRQRKAESEGLKV